MDLAKVLFRGCSFCFLLAITFLFSSCSDGPPSKMRSAKARVAIGDVIATWNNNEVTPDSFFDSLSGENKRWIKEKDGVWFVQEVQNGKTLKHYFVQNGTSVNLVYVKMNVDGQDFGPFGEKYK